MMIRDDYAGIGWSEGLKMLGLSDIGIELNEDACRTRVAAGHRTIRADLATYRPIGTPEGYIASPPCQTFSFAGGTGEGRSAIGAIVKAIATEDWEAANGFDDRTRHVVDAARVAVTCGAEWICMEQVPIVLPIWRTLGCVLDDYGYSTWVDTVNAADYGVPQTRLRAILVASKNRLVGEPPRTHASGTRFDLFHGYLNRWASWDETLDVADPSWELVVGAQKNATRRSFGMPSPTITGGHDFSSWRIERRDYKGGVKSCRLSVSQIATLQGFRSDLWWSGGDTAIIKQIGNAVPPLLAAHIVAEAIGFKGVK